MLTVDKSVSGERLKLTGILAIIGYGTGATVYKVGTESCRTMAMKVVNKRSKKNQHFSQRLRKEATILREIQHPNIIGFVAFLTSPAGNLLLLEEMDKSLGDRLEVLQERGSGPLPPQDVCFILAGLCSALDYLHTEKYILHGDIKSHNILIKGDIDEVKLCDFGLSLPLSPDGIGAVEEYVGTLCWAAPEALHEGPITPKVEIFSLGMVVYEMLTMKLPLFNYYRFQNEYENIAEEESTGFEFVKGSRYEDKILLANKTGKWKFLSSEDRIWSLLFPTDFVCKKGLRTKDSMAKFPETLGNQYYSFMEIFCWCTELDYRARPTARELLEVLETRVFTSLRNMNHVQLDTYS